MFAAMDEHGPRSLSRRSDRTRSGHGRYHLRESRMTGPFVIYRDEPRSEIAPFDTKREPVTSVDLQDFLAPTFPPRESILAPCLQRPSPAVRPAHARFPPTR